MNTATFQNTIDRTAEDAAEGAQTAGEFRSRFERATDRFLGTDGASVNGDIEAVVRKRRQLIAQAVDGREHRRIERKEAHVLGTSPIGGGEQGIRLNTRIFKDLRTEDDVEEIVTADEHERGHADSVQLRGRLMLPELRGMTAAQVRNLLFEGYAEIRGREGAKKPIEGHRRGQPVEIYGKGQDFACSLIQQTSRSDLEELMTGHGDLTRFSAKVLASRN